MIIRILAALAVPMALFVSAAEAPKPDRKSLVDMHEKMAAAHQKAAACLKKERPIEECNAEAMKQCPMKNMENCPFMEGGMGMMKGHMEGKHEHPQGEPERKKAQ